MRLLPIGALGLIGVARWLGSPAPVEDEGRVVAFDGAGTVPVVSPPPTTTPLVRAVAEPPAVPRRDDSLAVPSSTTPLVRAVPEAPAVPPLDDPSAPRDREDVNYAEKGVLPAL